MWYVVLIPTEYRIIFFGGQLIMTILHKKVHDFSSSHLKQKKKSFVFFNKEWLSNLPSQRLMYQMSTALWLSQCSNLRVHNFSSTWLYVLVAPPKIERLHMRTTLRSSLLTPYVPTYLQVSCSVFGFQGICYESNQALRVVRAALAPTFQFTAEYERQVVVLKGKRKHYQYRCGKCRRDCISDKKHLVTKAGQRRPDPSPALSFLCKLWRMKMYFLGEFGLGDMPPG